MIEGKLNPKHVLIDKLVRRVMGLSRMLHVHPEATDGRSEDAGKALAMVERRETPKNVLVPN